MRNYIHQVLCGLCMGIFAPTLFSQTGPICRNVNLPVAIDDSITFAITDIIPNAASSVPFQLEILNLTGGILRTVAVTNSSLVLRLYGCPYAGRQLTFRARNTLGTCSNTLTIKESSSLVIRGHSTNVYCSDSLVLGGVVGAGPEVMGSCSFSPPYSFVADWFQTFPCDGGDTSKVIYREYAAFAKNGQRVTGFDTIVVLRLPAISRVNTFCGENDTIYCGSENNRFGPFMIYENPQTGQCDTMFFLNPDGSPNSFDPKCGVLLNVEVTPFPTQCGTLNRYEVEIKQNCASSIPDNCPSQDVAENALAQESITPGYWSCTFWLMELDTTPPQMTGGADSTVVLSTNDHDCGASFVLPLVLAQDNCSGIKLVKAHVEGFGSVPMTRLGNHWSSSQVIPLPARDEPWQVIFEAVDICHNISFDTNFYLVEDHTEPIAVAQRTLNITIEGPKSWVNAESFDQNSWDNCDIAVVLARRSDWKEACINLCDSLTLLGGSPYGQIWTSSLSKDAQSDPVGAHYENALHWLETDGAVCNQLLAEAWRYDLMKHATLECQSVMSETEFNQAVLPFMDPEIDPLQVQQLGGGWSDMVPFSCEDLCTWVKVELLIMDYWCNWNRSWSDVLVEDKSPVQVVKDVEETLEISCKIFTEAIYELDSNTVSIQDLLEAYQNGNQNALSVMDAIFGGYQKVWLDEQGNPIDSAGNPLQCEIPFTDSICVCTDSMITRQIYDLQAGWITVDTTDRYCFYEADQDTFQHGALAVHCLENVQCEQSISFDLDACNQGTIIRTWKIWKECLNPDSTVSMAIPDTTFRMQIINIVPNCPLDPGMFTFPADTALQSCGLVFDPNGSGNLAGGLHPDSIGRPEYIFETSCRQVGVGYFDKVLEFADTTRNCSLVQRTWCFTDWCHPDIAQNGGIILDPEDDAVLFKYIQYILVCRLECSFDCSEMRDTAINCFDIPPVLDSLFDFFRTPGVVSSDTAFSCDVTLENNISIDTNQCGFGTITSTWYLIDQCNALVDSCKEVITLQSDSVSINRRTSYFGDTEPGNCSDLIILNPVNVTGDCPKLGPFTVTNDSPYPGNNASGVYEVGIHLVNYKVASACLDTIYLTDTITVIDDVNPLIFAFSDPCVNLFEWATDFQGDPLNPDIRDILGITALDNCGIDTVLLISLDSTFYPDAIIRDSILYTYKWQARDLSGNLSTMVNSTILVSDSCEQGQSNFIGDVQNLSIENESKMHIRFPENPEPKDQLLRPYSGNPLPGDEFELFQNQPNPFSNQTTIRFFTPSETKITLSIYDVTGRSIKTIRGYYSKGQHEISLDRSDFDTNGIYYYRIDSDSFSDTRKMMILD